jgi:DNA processing protein
MYSPEALLGPLNEFEQKYAPKHLFAAGRVDLLRGRSRVSIVGSRQASAEGKSRASRLARFLTSKGIVVVSGLAEGIDTAAHIAAIEAGGDTVAVLGTPLDRFYPKSNEDLQRRIMLEHLAISQFPIGHPVARKNFPLRNRTMALVAEATVIVEAGDGSGSLSQGWEALRLGRALLLMKSTLSVPGLAWPGKMLEYGALVLSAPEEMLEVLPSGCRWNPEDAPF